jgi:hypothetical protein
LFRFVLLRATVVDEEFQSFDQMLAMVLDPFI